MELLNKLVAYFNGKKTDIGAILLVMGPMMDQTITVNTYLFGVQTLSLLVSGAGGLLLGVGVGHKIKKAKELAKQNEAGE